MVGRNNVLLVFPLAPVIPFALGDTVGPIFWTRSSTGSSRPSAIVCIAIGDSTLISAGGQPRDRSSASRRRRPRDRPISNFRPGAFSAPTRSSRRRQFRHRPGCPRHERHRSCCWRKTARRVEKRCSADAGHRCAADECTPVERQFSVGSILLFTPSS